MTDYSDHRRPRPDPNGVHYMLSEAAHFDFQTLTGALLGVATLCATPPEEIGPDFGCEDAEPLFRLCGEFARGILVDCEVNRPRPKSV